MTLVTVIAKESKLNAFPRNLDVSAVHNFVGRSPQTRRRGEQIDFTTAIDDGGSRQHAHQTPYGETEGRVFVCGWKICRRRRSVDLEVMYCSKCQRLRTLTEKRNETKCDKRTFLRVLGRTTPTGLTQHTRNVVIVLFLLVLFRRCSVFFLLSIRFIVFVKIKIMIEI